MKIDRIKIQNFRSYKNSEGINLSDKTVLIGENNAGKSNVLRALDMCLDISPTVPHSIDDSFQREADDIEIEFWFTNLGGGEQEAFEEYIIDGEFWVKFVFPFEKDGSPDTRKFIVKTEVPKNSDFNSIDDKNAEELKEIYDRHEDTLKDYRVENWGGKHKKYIKPTIKRHLEEEDIETVTSTRENPRGIKNQLKEHLPEFRFFQSDRNIEDETKSSTNSVLGQLLENALEDVPQDDKDQIVDALETVDKRLNDAEKFEQITELESKLYTKLNQQIPLDDVTIRIDIPDLSEILTNVNVSIDDGIETDIATMGSGLHTAFILTCLWELSERDTDPAGIVFGLEEPENDLHPHAQRQLYDTLGDLVNQGYQVVLSTHSAHLVSGEEIFDVRRVEKQNNRSQIHTAEEQNFSQDQAESIQRRMTAENNEMFFSKVLLLGEGQTEEWILPVFNSLLDSKREKQYAFDRLGVTLISTDGKSGMKPFLRIADCYNIPAVALIDNDEDVDDGHSGIREEIDDIATVTQELPDDAEAELFNSVSLDEFQDVMSSAVPEYENTTEDLEQWRDGADISEFEVMREDFDEHSPSKPLFGKILAEQMTESQLPENFVDLMDTTRNIAFGKGIEDN